MKLPENVVPMPAEQRARIKELAQAATPGPWVVVPAIGSPLNPDGSWPHADRAKWGQHCGVEQGDEYGREASSMFYADSPHVGAMLQDADYIAAVSPDITLATLSYVEALEAEVARLGKELGDYTKAFRKRRQEWRAEQLRDADAIQAATSRATKAEAERNFLLAEFAAGITPADIPSCLKMHSEPAFGEFLRGANSVHATNLRWVRWKAAEFGLPWPLPQADFVFGYTPDPAAPTTTGEGKEGGSHE